MRQLDDSSRYTPGWMETAILVALGLLLLSVPACGNSNELETAPVRGTVSLDGKPVTSGAVLFSPERGRIGKGELQGDGSFVISTYSTGDGALVGRHQVAVVARKAADEFVEDVEQLDWIVPQRYATPTTSGLEFEVVADQKNVARFELVTQPNRDQALD